MTIYKYDLSLINNPAVRMPKGTRLLHVAEQHGHLCLWAVVNPSAPVAVRRFRIAGTGHPLDATEATAPHVGTLLMDGGSLVFHVFDLDEQ